MSTTFTVSEGKSFNLQDLSWDDNIIFDTKSGTVVMKVKNPNVEQHLPSGQSLKAKELPLGQDGSVSFASKGINYDVVTHQVEKGTEFQIVESCGK